MPSDDLVTTAEAAKSLGIARRTLQTWAASGIVTPAWTTPGGHHRWDLDLLKEELRGKRKRSE